MAAFDGRLFQGPWSKLILVLNQVGWCLLEPPWVIDQDGMRHNLLDSSQVLMRQLLERAWLQFVAGRHTHRKTMCDLHSLDPALLRADVAQLNALDRLAAIRSGAFWVGSQQAKFDLTKSSQCPHCGDLDSVEHRICHCPHYASRRKGFEWICDRWHALCLAFSHHLLPAGNPFLPEVRLHLQGLGDASGAFHCQPVEAPLQHLFTDGACYNGGSADLALASWGVVHAGREAPLSSGLVPGLEQTAPRAELWAVISALKWVAEHRRSACLWITPSTWWMG